MNNTETTREQREKLRKLRQHKAQLRRKRQLRRIAALVVVIAAVAVFLITAVATGLFEKRADANTITVRKDGRVIYEEIQKSTDDASEIKSFARRQISSYDKKNGKDAVRLERFSTRGDHIYLRTSYKDTATYADFTGYELFNGSMNAAEKAGYTFDTTFRTVTSYKSSDNASSKEASADAFADQKVLIIREDGIRVKVPGTVTGTGGSDAGNTKYRPGDDTVTIDRLSDDSPAQLTYIFYK